MDKSWTAITKADKAKARRLEKKGLARIEELPANYVGSKGRLIVSRILVVYPIKKEGASCA